MSTRQILHDPRALGQAVAFRRNPEAHTGEFGIHLASPRIALNRVVASFLSMDLEHVFFSRSSLIAGGFHQIFGAKHESCGCSRSASRFSQAFLNVQVSWTLIPVALLNSEKNAPR